MTAPQSPAVLRVRVLQVISEEADDTPSHLLETTTKLEDDLGLDFLNRVDLALALEVEFDIDDIPAEAATAWATVGDVVAYIATRIGQPAIP